MSNSNIIGAHTDITDMLARIREASAKTNVFDIAKTPAETNTASKTPSPFEKVMSLAKSAFDSVNSLKAESTKLQHAYAAGDTHVSLSQVVVAAQKSKLALEGLMVVRNKILEAYKEIMNMQV